MWHKLCLKDLLIENKYSFSGKAGSTGGLVSKALFTFCPTIKVESIAVDGDDSTDVKIKIGNGYQISDVKGSAEAGYVPVTEPTSAQDADVEVGFLGKRIFIGSIEPGGYEGTVVKPWTSWDGRAIMGMRFERRTNGLTRRLNRMQINARIPTRIALSPMNTPGSDGNMTNRGMKPKVFTERVLGVIGQIQWAPQDSQQLNDIIPEMMANRGNQDNSNLEQARELVEAFLAELQGPGAFGRNPRELNQIWMAGCPTVDWNGDIDDPKLSGPGVLEAESDGKCYWLQFKPQSNQPNMQTTIENHSCWMSPDGAWRQLGPEDEEGNVYPVPSDLETDAIVFVGTERDEPWKVDNLPGSTGSGLTDWLKSPERVVTAAEQAAIWQSTGDDYFVFLDVQSGDETARIVRSKTAPVPGIGHWSKQALQSTELIDEEGKPYTSRQVRDNVPGEAVFEIDDNGVVKSIPELEVKKIPLVSKIITSEANYTGQYRDTGKGRIDLYLTWDNWSWDGAEGYPFNPRMMKIMKKYEVKKNN